MRETVIWCDRHYGRSQEKVPAQALSLGLGGVWRNLDLCEDCAKELLEPVRALVAVAGIPEVEGTIAPSGLPVRPPARRSAPSGPGGSSASAPAATSAEVPAQRSALTYEDFSCWVPGCSWKGKRNNLAKHLTRGHQIHAADTMRMCPLCDAQAQERINAHLHSVHNQATVLDAYRRVAEAGDPDGRLVRIVQLLQAAS